MQKVGNLLNDKGTDVFSIAPDATVAEAIDMMAEHGIGSLLVMNDGFLRGIVTERDYARKVALEGRSSRESQVKDIMSENVLCVTPDKSVQECMAMMRNKRARYLPVVEGHKVIGIISIGDLVQSIINEQQHEIESLQYYINH